MLALRAVPGLGVRQQITSGREDRAGRGSVLQQWRGDGCL